ncbi:PEPxxWA-CTERM sorting domain-containing protein [Phenylobacterium sp.]|jgi:hypothetical protein|uniref:PEPxxWA-CTERM sorting domain-containing protein n=1 Tax=Phenylobacterium sp. TaxID=1871053 RepID=UPI002E360FC9|nr:PEPxxWA-CTERM sorting domain-containing protein [Phenylobacterium sp.]HEX4710211.1 PEPxxWA-CTERM sorting domain-containing protein [Phenylobacterium sp.]
MFKPTLAALAAATSVLVAFAASTANAEILTATFAGVVVSVQGGDILGLFGPPGSDLVGQAVTATYRIDDSKGVSSYNPPLSSVIFGGPAFGTQSPIATTLTIGGKSLVIAGTYESQANQSGPASGSPSVGYSTDDRSSTQDGFIDVSSANYLNNILTSYDYHIAPPYATDPNLSYGLLNENVFVGGNWTGAGTVMWLPTSFTFSVSSDVPEPSSWAMLLLGFAATGTLLRIARKGAASAG